MKKTLRIFVSSPGDVGRERHATAEIIRRLQSEFAEHCTLDPYFWEWEPVDFSKDYQANIPSTADFDIVICILWSRLGSRLSDQHKLPPDYTRPASSGTEYELLQALHGQQQHPDRLPDLLVWKNESPPPAASAPPLTREEEDERIRQRRALQDFLTSVTRDANTGCFVAALNSYQYLDEFEDLMDKKLRKLIQKHIGERTVKPKPQWKGSPFRDLDFFNFEHAPIFFGRSRAVGEVVRLLQHTLSKPDPCHFALILGASGSGKSSLARAGVLPLLTRPGVIEGIGLWRCAIVRPSDDSADLFQALAAALMKADKKIGDKKTDPHFSDAHTFAGPQCPPALPELADPESDHPQQSLAAELRAHPQTVAIRVKDQLNAVAKAHQTQQRHALEAQIASLTQDRQTDATLKQQALQSLQEPKARLVLLLDQMEELFTLNYAPEHLRAFLETIDVLARSGRVFVISTLRSDFYHRFQNPIPTDQKTNTLLVDLARDGARFDLLPPTPDEISQIIRRPASLAALQFEPHPTTAEHTLADTLRDEALADTEALPLLEHVLNRLYQAQLPRADGRLTFADYEDICGADVAPKTHVKTCRGVGGALGKHAEDIFTGQNLKPTEPPPPWTEDTFRAVFRCLVTFGKGEGDTDVPNRRAFTYRDLIQSDPAAQALVDTFIHKRLLIADTDAQSRPIVRLSHEALLTRWPRLANWLETAPVRDLMSQRRRLESSLRQWQEQNRTPDCYLQPGFELEEGKQLLEKHEAALKLEEREFIRASDQNHRETEYKEAKRRRGFIAILTFAAIVAIVGAIFGWVQARQANNAARVATQAREQALSAASDLRSQKERAFDLADLLLYEVRRIVGNKLGVNVLDAIAAKVSLALEQRAGDEDDLRTARLRCALLSVKGQVHCLSDNFPSGRELYEQSTKLARVTRSKFPSNFDVNRDLAICLSDLGDAQYQTAQVKECEMSYTESIELLKSLNPKGSNYSDDLIAASLKLADFYTQTEKPVESLKRYEFALQLIAESKEGIADYAESKVKIEDEAARLKLLLIPQIAGRDAAVTVNARFRAQGTTKASEIRQLWEGKLTYMRTRGGTLPQAQYIKIDENKSQPIAFNLHFEVNSASLGPESYDSLKAVLDAFTQLSKEHKLVVEGHTDNLGRSDLNMHLSAERAQSVKAWFVEHGIREDRIVAVGAGDTQPEVPNSSEDNRRLNRRIVFYVLPK